MANFEVWCVFWFLCVMCVAPVKIHCQLLKVYGVCVIPWKQADTVHGFQQWQDRCWQVVTWAPSMRGIQTHSATDVARELDIHWVVHRIVWDQQDYREVCALGFWESRRWWQSSLYVTVSVWHVRLIKESSFEVETWLITQNLKPEKGCVIGKLSSTSSKENRSIVINEDDCGKLSWDHKHVLVLYFLEHGDTVYWL